MNFQLKPSKIQFLRVSRVELWSTAFVQATRDCSHEPSTLLCFLNGWYTQPLCRAWEEAWLPKWWQSTPVLETWDTFPITRALILCFALQTNWLLNRCLKHLSVVDSSWDSPKKITITISKHSRISIRWWAHDNRCYWRRLSVTPIRSLHACVFIPCNRRSSHAHSEWRWRVGLDLWVVHRW